MDRKTPLLSETGWFPRRNVRFVFGTTPSALVKRRAATPPNLGGEF